MNNLGGPSESTAEEPAPEKQDSAQDDLSWLNNLGGAFSSQDTQTPESSTSKPFRTAPLNELTEETKNDTTPDWLRNAMEEPSMPAPGDLSMDWFKEQDKAKDIPPALSTDDDDSSSEPVPALTDIDLPVNDAPSFSAQDVDSMFNIDMPDWLTQDSGGPESPLSKSTKTPANAGESLDPVELPSWVQAMRPVDSAIEGTSATEESEQVPEREGPLAGFRGIIPSAPIGSSLRPKAFSLKLQVTDEQETGASLIEQIIVGEAAAHPKKSTKAASSQRALRWMISILFLGILSVIIGIGSQSLGIFPPGRVSELSNLIGAIPDGSPVLLVMDYDPSVAGELAAAAGPVLDQMALVRHSTFTFLAMSPNGPAMVEHLMLNTGIGRDVSAGGLGYQAEANYFNLGFLPGGSAGVLGFVSAPERAFPQVNVDGFTEFEAVVLLTDSAESGRVWVEQLEFAKQARPEIASKPLIVVSSAQAGPMLEPYVSSGQVDVLVNGLSDAAKYEFVNQSRPGMARAYWDSFGVGLMLAVLSIVLGGIWNFFIGIRERRAIADLG
ncbi:MAG TPA: hypothetical protein DCX53_09415 [Anaerolineae bacterium]|nr:hypothetical protein [Anaerolineae bacterium]